MAKTNPNMLTEDEVAEYLAIKVETLRNWRRRGNYGPDFFKLGGAVRYKQDDLDSWLECQREVTDE